MALRFVNRRKIESIHDLLDIQREQLRLAGIAYDGLNLPAAARLAPDEDDLDVDDDDEHNFSGFCDLWTVVDDGDEPVFDAWRYKVDSGTFFRAGTTEEVAGIVQFGLECADPELRLQLGPAMVRAQLLPRADLSYVEFSQHAAREAGER